MGEELTVRKTNAVSEPPRGDRLPAAIVRAGPRAGEKFVEFFTAAVRNENTRAAYLRAVRAFFRWAEATGLGLDAVRPVHVAAYAERLTRTRSAPTARQHPAAGRKLLDCLVVGRVVETNPAAAVRGPSHSAKKGKTPVLDGGEARRLLAAADAATVVGLRDRAVIGVMLYAFARAGAAVGMRVEDYYPQGKRWWVRLREKGGKLHDLPCHHRLEEYLDAYIRAAGIGGDRKGPLFRAADGRTGRLTGRPLTRRDAYRMVQRRQTDAGIATAIGCHTFRATAITNYLANG
ncbi:MAG: site-specific integrase, partial [Gemmataceae bacterium]|nr:site-specific integrase [Gemmataceae bacterium]